MPNKKSKARRRGQRKRRTTATFRKSNSAILEQKARELSPYMDMVLNPCDATLQPGIYGDVEGLVARTKTTVNITNASTCGYILWDPVYHNSMENKGGQVGEMNLMVWTSTSSHAQPTNGKVVGTTYELPFGRGDYNYPTSETTTCITDPAFAFANTEIVEDARLISACIRLTYFGTMLDSSGQIGFLENVPDSLVLTGGANGDPASVDELFRYTSNTHRLGLDTFEVIARPSDGTPRFRDIEESPYALGVQGGMPTTISTTGKTMPSTLCGLVWRSLDSKSRLVAEVTKNFEWRPAPLSGLVMVHPQTKGKEKITAVHTIADRFNPGWATRIGGLTKTIRTHSRKPPEHKQHHQQKPGWFDHLGSVMSPFIGGMINSQSGQNTLRALGEYVGGGIEGVEEIGMIAELEPLLLLGA